MSLGDVAEEILRRGNCSQDVICERIEKKREKKRKKETGDLKQVLPWNKWGEFTRKGTVETHELLDQTVGIRSSDAEALPSAHRDART